MALKFDVFGRRVSVERNGDAWSVYDLGGDGKRRPARDIVLPPDLDESEIQQYLGDLCHERASARHPNVVWLDQPARIPPSTASCRAFTLCDSCNRLAGDTTTMPRY